MRDRLRAGGMAGAAWLVGALVFFRPVWASGFNRVAGDVGDTRLIVYLHEHWVNVITGRAAWRTPAFFHPVSGTLGYSDTFVLDMVIFGPLRLLGCDQFLAYQIMLILLTAVGFCGCHLVCMRLLGTPCWLSLAMSAAFTFANNIAVQIVHPQLTAVYWLPWVMLLAARSLHATTRRGSAGWAFGTGSLLGAITYSTYYIGWFAVLVSAVFLVAFLSQRPLMEPGALRRVRTSSLIGAAGFAVWLIPFTLTYLPTLEQTGGRSRAEMLAHLPGVRDLVNFGSRNVWSWVSRRVGGDPLRTLRTEQAGALTPILMATLIGCAVTLARRTRGDRHPRTACARALVATSLITTMLPVRIAGHSLWEAIWFAVPGGRGIRAADRIEVVNSLVAVLAIATTMQVLSATALRRKTGRRVARLALPTLVTLIALEQMNTGLVADIDRSVQLEQLASVPSPPSECQSFVLVTETGFWVVRDVDAMLVSHEIGLPTVNGFSGSYPEGWSLFTASESYMDAAQSWAAQHHLDGLCGYDRRTHTWTVETFG